MSSRQYEVKVQTPGGVVEVVVAAHNQQEALAVVRSMYASLLAADRRYHVCTYAKQL